MRYVSIDLETTGLNEDTCQIVEFAAVLADSSTPDLPVKDLPTFHRYIVLPEYKGEPYALSMHPHIFRAIAKKDPEFEYASPEELYLQFRTWLTTNGMPTTKIVAAGKNFGAFDLQFIKRNMPRAFMATFGHRFLDPAMLFFNPFEDKKLPDLATCLKRAGLDNHVSHNALEDAQQVVMCLNYAFMNTCFAWRDSE